MLAIEKGIMIGKRFESYYDGIMVMTACRDSQETICRQLYKQILRSHGGNSIIIMANKHGNVVKFSGPYPGGAGKHTHISVHAAQYCIYSATNSYLQKLY